MKLDLETLKHVKFMFDIHSDHSTMCNGYNSLCRIIEEEEKKENFSQALVDDTITLTKEELITFKNDIEEGVGSWSDTSYKICRFIGVEPTDGV